MKYRLSCYTDVILETCRFMLGSLMSFQCAMAVIFTGLFGVQMLRAFGEPQYMQDLIFIPCAVFFLWSFCMSIVDMNIERGTL
jgi:hypothetical protein